MMPARVFIFDIDGGSGGSAESLRILLAHLDPARYTPVLGFGRKGNRDRWAPYPVMESNFAGFDNYDFAPMRAGIKPLYFLMRWLLHLPHDIIVALGWLRRTRPDLVHLNVGQALSVGLAARLVGIPVVWHIREMVYPNLAGRFQDALYAKCSRHIIAISAAVAKRLPRCRNKCTVIYNGTSLHAADAQEAHAFRGEHGIGEDRFVILLLGGLQISKGPLFLAGVADALRDDPRFLFLIAGDFNERPAGRWHGWLRKTYRRCTGKPGERAQIRQRWEAAELRGQTKFPGRVHAETAIAASNVVVCPNLTTEPFGRTVIEAYAQGRPVLTTDVPAFDETVESGITGWRLPADTEAWAGRLRWMAGHDGEVAAMKPALLKAASRYEPSTHARAVMDIYDRALLVRHV
jgi:glycosyltransferase involved in cell wall biosynthesis